MPCLSIADPRIMAMQQTVGFGKLWRMAQKLSDDERATYEAEALRLREEHRDLDAAIEALELVGKGDQLQIQRLKKRKLFLRDRLSFLDDQLTPDIIA